MSHDKAQWYFNASPNPFDATTTPEWKEYSSSDNAMIEEFFQKKSGTVALQNHVIHFKEKMQVSKSDFHKQRPVKREET